MPRAKKMKQEEMVVTPPAAISAAMPKDDALFDMGGEPSADVFETATDFVAMVTIAGVNIKDLDINIEKDMIVIKGDRPDPHAMSDKKYFYQECYFGPFARKIVLPANIHTDKASAEMDRGILTIKIPKMTS